METSVRMSKLKSQISKVKKWIRENRREAIILGIILLLGAFFRLYKIDEYMTFLGDEGRDAIVVRRLLVNFDPILVGPGTSIGNMYLGPIYYYMMAPALLLANFSPVGPAAMVALLGIATIFFVWYVAKEWFPPHEERSMSVAGLIASGLYAVSPVVINYSKSSWNPNIMPFFALLCIYSLWKVFHQMNFKWLVVLGTAYAFVLQSHYLGLLLAPTFAFFLIISYLKIKNSKSEISGAWLATLKNFLRNSLLGLVVFVGLMSPLIIFDARHEWRNFDAIATFFTQRQATVSFKPWKAIPNIYPILRDDFITRIIAAYNPWIGKYLTLFLTASVFIYLTLNIFLLRRMVLVKEDDGDGQTKYATAVFLIFVWMFVGLVGLGLYKQHIYDHYFGFMFPAPFLLIGALSQKIWERFGDDGKIFVVFGGIILVVANIVVNPLRYPANFQMQRSIDTAKVIQKESKGNKFNLAVIAERNYEDGYQYFLEKWGDPVVDIDPLRLEETVADQLFVVCELSNDKCDPTHSPKAEVANFGWSKIDGVWGVSGVSIYKLVHTQ